MDEKRLRQTLHEIAEQEISDDMNLLPEIRAQLEQTTTPRTRRRLWRTGRMLAFVAILLMSVAAVYAVYRQQTGDPGLDAARDANLVTELDMSQTLNDVTLTLNWMYADAHRMAMGYSVTAPESQAAYAYSSSIAINDADNSFYLSSDVGGGGNGGGEIGAPADFTYSVAVGFMQNPPQELHMHVEIMLGTNPNPIIYEDGSGGGGGGGFGGGGDSDPDATPVPGVIVPFFTEVENPIGPYSFDFTLPYIGEVVVEPNQTIEANNIPIRLERVSVTPSQTIGRLCYTIPDWAPDSTVTMNDITVAGLYRGVTVSPTPLESGTCYDVIYPAPYFREATTLTLTVSHLRQNYIFTQERIDEFVRLLHEQGIEIEIHFTPDMGSTMPYRSEDFVGYSIISSPDGMDVGAAVMQAYDVFSDFRDGPWTFTVDVPGE